LRDERTRSRNRAGRKRVAEERNHCFDCSYNQAQQ
jgi:hypothetical protein